MAYFEKDGTIGDWEYCAPNFQSEGIMKIPMIVLSLAFVGFVVASSFSSSAYAGYRSAQMSGGDPTYRSVGKCHAGACNAKKSPKAPKPPKKM